MKIIGHINKLANFHLNL
jgi:hypothetical protein